MAARTTTFLFDEIEIRRAATIMEKKKIVIIKILLTNVKFRSRDVYCDRNQWRSYDVCKSNKSITDRSELGTIVFTTIRVVDKITLIALKTLLKFNKSFPLFGTFERG